MGSLRNRLLLGSSGVITLALLLSGLVIYSKVSSTLYKEFDDSIHEKALVFASLTEFTDEGLEVDINDMDFQEFRDGENSSYFQVWRADGAVLKRSESLRDRDLTNNAGDKLMSFVDLPDGRKGRQASVTFYPRIDEDLLNGMSDEEEVSQAIRAQVANSSGGRSDHAVTIVVAASTAEIESFINRLSWLLVVVAVVSVSVSLGLIIAVVWTSLLPLKRLADNIESIDEESLADRIDAGSVPEEIVPIVNRLNGLLQRVETVVHRERAFSSDVSHELRTPLAGIRSTIDVCLNRPRMSAEYTEALHVCHKICCQSQRMVESLLAISRLETGNVRHDVQSVDVTKLIAACLEDFEADATLKEATMDSSVLEPMSIEADEEKLRVVIRNLLQNAVSHCDDHGRIRISSACSNGSVQIAIENTGNKISSDQVSAICDRFWRGDAARAKTGDHFGLGLSLVKKLLNVMEGRIEFSVSGSVFRAVVDLPVRGRASNAALV